MSTRAAALPPEERRAALVETTLHLLIEHGPSVTTRQIAEAAGIAEGTIFRAFPDKEHLIEAVVERVLEPSQDRVDPRCALFGECGGCQLQHLSYKAQLRAKHEIVCEQMRRIADRMQFTFAQGVCRAHYAAVLISRGKWTEAERQFADIETHWQG